ncbi:type II toxin-antitoxin system RelE/ParE family toxin [Streptomyces sp. NPDC088732]|uniref:type II toxin-antitoxin system RelE/ParE family toxin n=1 Tax=Streptomyces sp. NPDC088732 TaxID=3365879 RepID=UPI0038289911
MARGSRRQALGSGSDAPGSSGGTGSSARRAVYAAAGRELRELRFYCGERQVRITYWIAEKRRIIMLTVFVKTRMRETDEVNRARRALQRCVDEGHTADHEENL